MNIVSFGGGTNSTAMIIGMYLHKIPIDLILFADTGGEQPHTYEFMGTFNEWLVMNDEELAKFMLSNDGAAYCKNNDRDSTCYLKGRDGMTACELCALDWLREEAEE